jgi:hypothetical protein
VAKCKSARPPHPRRNQTPIAKQSPITPVMPRTLVLNEKRIGAWVDWPWHRLRHAAGLAGALIKMSVPPVPRYKADVSSPAVPSINGGPYRPTYIELGEKEESIDAIEARELVSKMLGTLETYGSGMIPIVEGEYLNELANLYWFAKESKQRVRELTSKCWNRGWRSTADWLVESMNFLEKFAAGGMTIDVEADGLMRRIAVPIASQFGVDEVESTIVDWRIRDAADGKPIDEDVKPAFLASWEAGEYAFAYQMLKDFMA